MLAVFLSSIYTHAYSHTNTQAMRVLASLYPLSMKPAAFIHALQHLTEDSNGVLWVVGNPMPLPQLRDASTSSNRDTSLRNLRRHQRHSLPFQDPVASEEQDYSPPWYNHTFFTTGSLMCTWIFKYFSVLLSTYFLLLLLFNLLHQLLPLCSLFLFVSPLLCQSKNCLRANNITDARAPLLLLFLLSLTTQLTAFNNRR